MQLTTLLTEAHKIIQHCKVLLNYISLINAFPTIVLYYLRNVLDETGAFMNEDCWDAKKKVKEINDLVPNPGESPCLPAKRNSCVLSSCNPFLLNDRIIFVGRKIQTFEIRITIFYLSNCRLLNIPVEGKN